VIAADIRPLPWTGKPAANLLKALGAWIAAEVIMATRWFGRAMCGLTGHEMVRHFDAGRVSLQCLSCGHQTAGWTIEAKRAA
jgi:hypothetical protein